MLGEAECEAVPCRDSRERFIYLTNIGFPVILDEIGASDSWL